MYRSFESPNIEKKSANVFLHPKIQTHSVSDFTVLIPCIKVSTGNPRFLGVLTGKTKTSVLWVGNLTVWSFHKTLTVLIYLDFNSNFSQTTTSIFFLKVSIENFTSLKEKSVQKRFAWGLVSNFWWSEDYSRMCKCYWIFSIFKLFLLSIPRLDSIHQVLNQKL